MSNRTLFWMTGLGILGIAILLLMNALPMMGVSHSETYLKLNDVKGIAVEHNGKPYTLNFEQQNELIGYLNKSVPTTETASGSKKALLPISKIIIYRFNKPELIITPVEYQNHQLIFSAPEWNREGLMKDKSGGSLEKLLSKTFDT